MKEIVLEEPMRLDLIVLEHYKTLSVYEKVLEANTHLGSKVILAAGDVVKLPVLMIEKEEVLEDSLW